MHALCALSATNMHYKYWPPKLLWHQSPKHNILNVCLDVNSFFMIEKNFKKTKKLALSSELQIPKGWRTKYSRNPLAKMILFNPRRTGILKTFCKDDPLGSKEGSYPHIIVTRWSSCIQGGQISSYHCVKMILLDPRRAFILTSLCQYESLGSKEDRHPHIIVSRWSS